MYIVGAEYSTVQKTKLAGLGSRADFFQLMCYRPWR